jgi:nucleoside phosphorylase
MNRVDVLLITALPEEFAAARDAGLTARPGASGIAGWQEQDSDGLAPYLLGDYPTEHGRRLSVALARPTRMGGRRTGPIATTLTDLLKPTCLAMCGVCAGNPDDTAPGDIVVAEMAYEYDEGKKTGTRFEGDHEQYPQDARWLRAAQDFEPDDLPSHGAATAEEAAVWFLERLHRDQDPRTHPARKRYFPRGTWQPRLQTLESDGLIQRREGGWSLTEAGTTLIQRTLDDDVDGPERLPFAVLTGPMASGSAVIKDPAIWKRLKSMGVRKIAALEMEAATIATVAHERQVPHWLVAKGVMDRADPDKDDRYKEFAARASAEVLYHLLARLVPTTGAGGVGKPSVQVLERRTTGAFLGRVKREIIHRLQYDWQDLADVFGVPSFATARFRPGDEPRELWDWLASRDRLAELPDALDEIGRSDLAALLRSP